jgi:acyl carrier protein
MSSQTKEQLLIAAIARQIKNESETVSLDSKIEDLGLDSLKFMLLIIDLKERHEHLNIDIKRVGQVETVQDLANIIEEVR